MLLPPLLVLLPLAETRGPSAAFMMMFAAMAALWSIVSIVVRLLLLLLRKGDPRKLLRPVLVVALVYASFGYLQTSVAEARDIGYVEAQRLQAECTRAGRCPDALAVGTGDDTSRDIATPSTHLHWPLRYIRPPERDAFELMLNEGFDVSRSWEGGTKKPLTYSRYDDGHVTPLPPGGDGPPVFADD